MEQHQEIEQSAVDLPDKGGRRVTKAVLSVLGLAITAVVAIYAYGTISRNWSPIGGTKGRFFLLEVPLFLFVQWLVYVRLPGTRTRLSRVLGYSSAAVPPLMLYVLIDGGFGYLQRGLRLSDFRELMALLEVSPSLAVSIMALLAGVLAVPSVRLVALVRARSNRALLAWLLPRIAGIALFLVACTMTASPLRTYAFAVLDSAEWSEQWALRRNGRFSTTLFIHFRRAAALDRLVDKGLTEEFVSPFDRSLQDRRNVHVIVLESFVDLRLFDGVRFDRSPLHPSMRALLGDEQAEFDLVTTPVYGGGTAQTEFELLTGLPALGRVESVEFNALEGHAVPSLVRSLRAQGYQTYATIGTAPRFYNGRRPYLSMGFEEVHFRDGTSYLGGDPDETLFDGDLLERNLAYVSNKFQENGKPYFNYVVGIYGHHPYVRDQARQPVVCRRLPDGDGSSILERVANLFYYRTGALAEFVGALRQSDPSAIVFVTSDHLPPLVGESISYRHDLKTNICFALDAGQRIRWAGNLTYEVPYVLFGRLCGESIEMPDREELERRYLTTIAAGMGLTSR